MHSDQNRAFNFAVLASIVIHAALLFGFAPREPSKRAAPPAPIVARLAQPPAAESAPAPVSSTPEAAQRPPVKPRAKSAPAKKPVPKTARAEAPAPEPLPAPPPAPVIDAAPDPVPALPAAPPVVAQADPAPAPTSTSVEAMDAGSLAQYRLQLISIARKYKRYPRVATDNNWEGGVVVRLVIGASGMISALSIKTSSGHEVLDQQALEMFKKATPQVQIPPALRGKEFAIEVRAIYSLKDQDSG
jgi:periplasmic protein TonB